MSGCRVWVGGAVAVLMFWSAAPAWGQEEAAGVYYGDGLRQLAEGRYEEALVDLYRAYGISGRAEVLSAVVGAYDAMGHCGAARQQRELFEARHADEVAPGLKRCARSGEVELACGSVGGAVEISASIEARCGDTLELAAGTYQVRRRGAEAIDVDVEAGSAQRVDLMEPPSPKGAVARLRGPGLFGTDVQRLRPSAPAYTVYQSADGLYQIWVRSAGDERRYDAMPRVEIVCPDDAGERVDPGCLWLRELRRQSGYTDNPTRLEVVVPRVH